ncbi:MAG: hypothetical protein MUP71_14375 [Candidatus Aminicenantes bacterium]|nr:hypothetical protein [Candidatus Aminicenantes bacterium]
MNETRLRHKTMLWFCFFSLLFFLQGTQMLSAQAGEETKKQMVVVEKHRMEFKSLLQKNKNYFGTFPELKIKAVLPLKLNRKYEELGCLGFQPQNDRLQAIIRVKLPYGYSGDLCHSGSIEYVRVFADWNGNGIFEASEDAGLVSVNVHNIPNLKTACLDKFKPLSYALTLKLDPKKFPCIKPNLVKVRAILSWEMEPTAGNPAFAPVWGNVVEQWIQIKPVWLLKAEELKIQFAKEGKIAAEEIKMMEAEEKPKALTVMELKNLYSDLNVPELRFNVAEIQTLAMKVKKEPALLNNYKIDPKYAQLVKDIGAILAEKPNVRYEQLGCLGWQYDLEQLVATLKVKLPLGYSGDLCHHGSQEYVAFWAYEWDQIEQMCSWKYLGTTAVNVHDIAKIPPAGLQYAVSLPTDLSRLRGACAKPGIVKIRAILSWQVPPPANNPHYNPVWGNRIDALIQLKPGSGGEPGTQVPFISQIGGMPVAGICGNDQTVMTSTLGHGYANGPSVLGGYTALESPFGGLITVCGRISYPPDDPVEAAKLQYKLQYKKLTSSNWQDLQNDFWIVLNKTTDGGVHWTQSYFKQTATSGYYKYHVDWDGAAKCLVEGEVLGQWQTPVFEGDGLYEIRVLLNSVSSNIIKVLVDNTAPAAEIKWDFVTATNPCTTISGPGSRSGTFKATDSHFYKYTLSVLPPKNTSVIPPFIPPTVSPLSEYFPALAAPGKSSGTFNLTIAADTTPCGYVVLLQVWDRTIRNNHFLGNYNKASVGMCVLE